MKPCLMCQSENVFVYKKDVASAGGAGPELLPALASGWLKTAEFRPVVCADCGYVMYFAAQASLDKLHAGEAKGWERDTNKIACACRYDLTGNTTGTCPECGNVLPHWRGTGA